ncbi:MAG: HigA family addiction module antidote protein [Bacteroidales bacterium]|nr:HigA family addiction module antidote protein [Bacteroidales bacterium]
MNKINRRPFITTHPGELIKDEIKSRGITQKQLSVLSGISPSIISETIKGRRSVSLNMAFGLEKSLGIPAEMWLNLQNQYDLDVAESNLRETKSRFTFIRLLIERAVKDSETVTDDDRQELTKISAILRDMETESFPKAIAK